ncbi:MAG: hypothetical protein IPH12_07235 [Saprospirales bacterium]|jgi:hypothetical protein|nr:hypothetical protein [Saprospirales bacterium]MBK8922660.1 hypothetical protein [Saprospirales bacterium]
MRPIALWSALFALAWYSCRSKTDVSPEDVVQRWQSYIDHNQFDSARLYSTELARSYVDFLDALTQGDSAEIFETRLYNLSCDIRGDSAVCHYLIEGEMGEKIPDTLILYKIKGHWRVHRVEGFLVIPVDTLQPGDERILFPGDSLDAELE